VEVGTEANLAAVGSGGTLTHQPVGALGVLLGTLGLDREQRVLDRDVDVVRFGPGEVEAQRVDTVTLVDVHRHHGPLAATLKTPENPIELGKGINETCHADPPWIDYVAGWMPIRPVALVSIKLDKTIVK